MSPDEDDLLIGRRVLMARGIKKTLRFALAITCGLVVAAPCYSAEGSEVRTQTGAIQGTSSEDGQVQIFKGVPYAAPPVGALRWKEPQPVPEWDGVRKATKFGARCMQGWIYDDMVFRDAGPSEDCLYLNVWTPKAAAGAKLPVMVWIYGGGFQAGATSEPRQDGERLARLGVVVVSMNYRLGIFGFFSHPELTKESRHHASGNYGLLDQAAALEWIRENIAAFGGDPQKVTIFGESAGSVSVSALMASPVSKKLMARAMGESGAMFGKALKDGMLRETEKTGSEFAKVMGVKSIEQLRGLDAQSVLDAALKNEEQFKFRPNIDGYFLTTRPTEIYSRGELAHVPLLAGWNRDEGSVEDFFEKEPVTKDNYVAKMKKLYWDAVGEALRLFPTGNEREMKSSAELISAANFIAYGTWKWIEMQGKTGGAAVYRYEFDQAPPRAEGDSGEGDPPAYHSAEIEFVFGVLDSKKLPWRAEDYEVSKLMGIYWTNFAKTGTPNGPGVPDWPRYEKRSGYLVMHLGAKAHAAADSQRKQYEFLDRMSVK